MNLSKKFILLTIFAIANMQQISAQKITPQKKATTEIQEVVTDSAKWRAEHYIINRNVFQYNNGLIIHTVFNF